MAAFQSHPYFYTKKNSQEPFGKSGFGAKQQYSKSEAHTDLEQGNDKDHKSDSAGNHSVAIATVSIVAVTAVVAMTVIGIRTWRKRKTDESQWLLSYREI